MILCGVVLLDSDNYGVFELTLIVLLMQVSKTFLKLNHLYLYGITVLCCVVLCCKENNEVHCGENEISCGTEEM